MLPYDKSTLDAAATAMTYSAFGSTCATTASNPCAEISINTSITTHINSDYVEISGKRFSTKQLAYLLSKLLEEHPECQV